MESWERASPAAISSGQPASDPLALRTTNEWSAPLSDGRLRRFAWAGFDPNRWKRRWEDGLELRDLKRLPDGAELGIESQEILRLHDPTLRRANTEVHPFCRGILTGRPVRRCVAESGSAPAQVPDQHPAGLGRGGQQVSIRAERHVG